MNKDMKAYIKALALAMRGNLWYKHVDVTSGVTNDAWVEERISYDVLIASTKSKKHMRSLGYQKASYAEFLHTFLTLADKGCCSGEDKDWFAVQYNRHCYTNNILV